MAEALGENGFKEWLAPVVHRHSACYNTPYPTNTFAFLSEDPQKMEETENEEPGFLITDLFGLMGFKKAGFNVNDACELLKVCARYGIDAAGVAEQSLAAGKTSIADVSEGLAGFTGDVTRPGKGVFSPWCPTQPIFGEFDAAGADVAAWWERRMAVAYIFGIHPIFAVMSPEIVEDDLVEIATIGTELEISQEILDNAVAYLMG
jgi:aldehyde:ferredoxin oxidoreductase